jgi:NAD(P)-dependent dehydrogenase (short-subunit alcohol dehydrogenase family)
VIGDIDEAAAKDVASAAGSRVSATALDVRDADAVGTLVRDVAAEHGRLDLIFNNAGIAVAGPVDELTLEHWDRVIDVNLRGVVHGIHAAYPVMLRQGSGHIVNTASLAGLLPAPTLTPYAAAKYAVVGLSLSLRAEAAPRGVRVSVVCPGFIDTPLLGRVNAGLPRPASWSGEDARERLAGRLYSPDALALDVLRGVDRNRAVIVAPRSARAAWRTSRYAPGLSMRALSAMIRRG